MLRCLDSRRRFAASIGRKSARRETEKMLELLALDAKFESCETREDVCEAFNAAQASKDAMPADWRVVLRSIHRAVVKLDKATHDGCVSVRDFEEQVGAVVAACMKANLMRSSEKVVGYDAHTNVVTVRQHPICEHFREIEAATLRLPEDARKQLSANCSCCHASAAVCLAMRLAKAEYIVEPDGNKLFMHAAAYLSHAYKFLRRASPVYGKEMRPMHVKYEDTGVVSSIPMGSYGDKKKYSGWKPNGEWNAHVILRVPGSNRERCLDVSCGQFAPGAPAWMWVDGVEGLDGAYREEVDISRDVVQVWEYLLLSMRQR